MQSFIDYLHEKTTYRTVMNEDLINDKLQLAKLYFKTKDYKSALTCYNDIIQLTEFYSIPQLRDLYKLYKIAQNPVAKYVYHPKLLSILDQRAATHEKLGDVERSLKDCRRMLDCCPVELRAYLRIGKNYLKQNNDIKAYKNFQIGYHTVNRFQEKYPNYALNGELYQKLKLEYSKLNSHLKRKRHIDTQLNQQLPLKKIKRSTDPFMLLNNDVMELIFSLVPFTQVLRSRLVCKLWYNSLMTYKQLYCNMTLKPRIKHKEFTQSMNFFNNFKNNHFNVRVSQTSSTDFTKILDTIIKLNYRYRSIEFFNILTLSDLFTRLDKFAFNFRFNLVSTLKLILDSTRDIGIVLGAFKNLKSLDIIIADNQPTAKPVLKYKAAFNKLLPQESTHQLDTLVLINKNSITNYPPLLSFQLNLSKLIISGFEFNNIQHNFGMFISHCTGLKTLILENNRNLLLKLFLNNLVNYHSSFKLNKFIFREYTIGSSLNLQEFNLSDFHNFDELSYLDLYSSSLSNNGLLKFLSGCPKLTALTLGASNYIYFKNDSLSQFIKITLIDILMKVPNLAYLSLIDLNLDNLSLRYFHKDLMKLDTKLEYLDLGFNSNIDGIGLLGFLDYKFKLSKLVVDGIHINKDTLNLIEAKFGTVVTNDPLKPRWTQYGVNSFILN